MVKTKFKKAVSLMLAVVMSLTAFMGIGATTAFAAVGEKADVYLVDYPRSGDTNNNGEWGHGNLNYMNGWKGLSTKYTGLRAMGSYSGNIAYCIEPGTGQRTGDTLTEKDENFFNNISPNGTISGDDIRLLIGRILQYGYPGYSDDELYDIMVKSNAENLYDERVNLNIQLSQPIIVIGDLGRWNGRVSGYKMIDSGNIKDCLYSDTDYTEWYVDKYGDLRADAVHHDGTNHYLYRVFKDGVTDTQIENLQDKIYNGKATRADITRVTKRLGDDIAGVYGFPIPNQRQTNEQAR